MYKYNKILAYGLIQEPRVNIVKQTLNIRNG